MSFESLSKYLLSIFRVSFKVSFKYLSSIFRIIFRASFEYLSKHLSKYLSSIFRVSFETSLKASFEYLSRIFRVSSEYLSSLLRASFEESSWSEQNFLFFSLSYGRYAGRRGQNKNESIRPGRTTGVPAVLIGR